MHKLCAKLKSPSPTSRILSYTPNGISCFCDACGCGFTAAAAGFLAWGVVLDDFGANDLDFDLGVEFEEARGVERGLLAATGIVCCAFLRWLSFASRRARCFLFLDMVLCVDCRGSTVESGVNCVSICGGSAGEKSSGAWTTFKQTIHITSHHVVGMNTHDTYDADT